MGSSFINTFHTYHDAYNTFRSECTPIFGIFSDVSSQWLDEKQICRFLTIDCFPMVSGFRLVQNVENGAQQKAFVSWANAADRIIRVFGG